jgi:hypothetical protein
MMARQNCWEYNKCGRDINGIRGIEEGICPASTMTSMTGLNNGKNGGRICWAVAGSFSATNPDTGADEKSSCVHCDFFKLVEREEGDNFTFLSPDQLLVYEPYMYGKRKSARFDIHLDLELIPGGDITDYLVAVTSNFSRDGFSFVSGDFNIGPKETIRFKMTLPHKRDHIGVSGDLVWKHQIRDRCLAGIKIREMENTVKREILNYAYGKCIQELRSQQE